MKHKGQEERWPKFTARKKKGNEKTPHVNMAVKFQVRNIHIFSSIPEK